MSRPLRTMLVALALLCALGPLAAGAPDGARRGDTDAAAEARYREAAAGFHALRAQAEATPAQWRAVSEQFQGIHQDLPDGRRGADALYSAALAQREAWRASGEWRDLSRAAARFREYGRRYAGDRLADDALMHLAGLLREGYEDPVAASETYRRIVDDYAAGDQHLAAQRKLADVQEDIAAAARKQSTEVAAAPTAPDTTAPRATPAGMPDLTALLAGAADGDPAAQTGSGRVRRVQFWSSPEWTRVILTADAGVRFEMNRLGATGDRPERVYFDLRRAEPDDELVPVTAVGDGVLERIRISRFDAETTRVVLDLRSIERVEVQDFRLPTASKIVVDLHPPAAQIAAARRRAAAARTPVAPASAPAPPVARGVPALGALPEALVQVPADAEVKSIIIDPGHGGHDPGAQGFGLSEKDLALDISLRLAELLRERHPKLRVGLTRETDRFVPLQERPQIAKRFGADLFVSVHLNANSIRRFHGVETYFLNLTTDRDSLQVAARENATTAQHVSDLNDILQDLLRDTTLVESGELAKQVQASLVGTLRNRHRTVRDLGVKQAPFLVLMGAEMPGVLVEAGFVTNRHENERLRDSRYLNRIAEGIYEGLRRYTEQQSIIDAGRVAGPLAARVTH